MKKANLIAVGLIFILVSCNDSKKEVDKPLVESSVNVTTDPVVYSFVIIGCNRIDRHDRHNTAATNDSRANVAVLQSIFNDIAALKNKPSLFFFMGDLVLGESDTKDLDKQLNDWLKQYKDTKFSAISTSGIEMVAMPGNHEMLDAAEKPLAGTTDIWLKYMSPYMPANRNHVTGTDSLNNRMTFSFVQNNIAFIVMNTDTYNEPNGIEGQVPTQWIINQVNAYKATKSIKQIFVLGHKPYYVDGNAETGHGGLPDGPTLWPVFNKAGVVAMLSAHKHDYQRWQLPADTGTYQIIAGNGGSKGEATFYGYTIINILKSGKVELISRGFDKQPSYYAIPVPTVYTTRDSTILTWTKNANPYK